jgi:hypothetical protein
VSRILERVVLAIAIFGAGVAMYLALDARDAADAADERASRAETALAAAEPTLLIREYADDPFSAPRAAEGSGLNNFTVECPRGSFPVGGGFNSLDGATIIGSVPSGPRWLVNAANLNGGRGRVAPSVLCASGEGGLKVRRLSSVQQRAVKP